MMTIKDLSVSKDLDRAAMTEVRGGQTINSTAIVDQDQHLDTYHGFGVGVQQGTAVSEVNAAELNINSFSLPAYPVYKKSAW